VARQIAFILLTVAGAASDFPANAGYTDFPFHPSRFATDTCKKWRKANNRAASFQLNLSAASFPALHIHQNPTATHEIQLPMLAGPKTIPAPLCTLYTPLPWIRAQPGVARKHGTCSAPTWPNVN